MRKGKFQRSAQADQCLYSSLSEWIVPERSQGSYRQVWVKFKDF